VTFSETGGQYQYFLLHQSLGDPDYDQGQKQMEVTRESIRSLMDICGTQSKLLPR
jgi:hypothetical protein